MPLERMWFGCTKMPNNPDKFLIVGGYLPAVNRYKKVAHRAR